MRVPWSQRPSGADKFTLKVNETIRFGTLDEQPEMVRSHYFGRQYQCTHPDCIWCEMGIEWKERFALYIVVYSQEQGVLKQPVDGHVVPWFFGSDKYLILHAWSALGDLRQRDLIATCVEEKFQRFAMSQSPDPAAWLVNEPLKAKVMDGYGKLPRDLSTKIAQRVSRSDAMVLIQRRQAGGGQGFGGGQQFGGGRDQRTAVGQFQQPAPYPPMAMPYAQPLSMAPLPAVPQLQMALPNSMAATMAQPMTALSVQPMQLPAIPVAPQPVAMPTMPQMQSMPVAQPVQQMPVQQMPVAQPSSNVDNDRLRKLLE